ncbi:hypothetical protein ASE01_00860 [Nocardioides sp. Root190]|uniref:nucleotidyltransferase domain-containing protein n=1 Tax=Nocardioides sp. Root190 TaxID=1736488 RepID=UPI0006F5C52C|nr:nucleotidyltransferase [Nocardioides sp. Root190]KRB80089.1 hypothetical protein ASE01_00860 [Nocardioides sp. Root190]
MTMSDADRNALVERWTLKSSPSEQNTMVRAERMIREAIDQHPPLQEDRGSLHVYAKGSYANRTNVRRDSDVDIVVENRRLYYSDYIDTKTAHAAVLDPYATDYTGVWIPETWRDEVENALRSYFGLRDVDTTGDVAVTIAAVPGSRPSSDVVPAFEYRRFDSADRRATHHGSKVFKKSGGAIINYPFQQLENGNAKDRRTGGKYKEFARALKNGENALVEAGLMGAKPSYLMECLAYNIPDADLTPGFTHSSWFQHALATLFNRLRQQEYAHDDWVEPNELKWLFSPAQRWSVDDARELASRLWDFLDYP